MRIIVFSDSHGNYSALRDVVEKHRDEADFFIHLGDGEREFERIAQEYPALELRGVRGNCDWASTGKLTDALRVSGRKVFFTHGHIFHVKAELDSLKQTARGLGATIALFGHTHIAFTEYDDGLYLLNPGSISAQGLGRASYGIIDITPAGIITNIVRV